LGCGHLHAHSAGAIPSTHEASPNDDAVKIVDGPETEILVADWSTPISIVTAGDESASICVLHLKTAVSPREEPVSPRDLPLGTLWFSSLLDPALTQSIMDCRGFTDGIGRRCLRAIDMSRGRSPGSLARAPDSLVAEFRAYIRTFDSDISRRPFGDFGPAHT
jgi:hypothetical protein